MKKHLQNVHTESKDHKCKVCGKAFTSTAYLKGHMIVHSGKTVSCAVCSKVLKNNRCLVSHMRILHQDTESDKEWECNQCYKTFKFEKYLNLHIKRTHTEKCFNCEKCTETFKSKWFLKKHQSQHEKIN